MTGPGERSGGAAGPPARREPPLWRPFALLAFGAATLGGVPVGIWMLTRLYWGGGQVPPALVWLHAHLQLFGFFGTLIPGVALHLLPRFAGRPVTAVRWGPRLAGALGLALALRVAGTAAGWSAAPLAAALVQAAAFSALARWVWGTLDGAALRLTRLQLAGATAGLALACLLEAAVRTRALAGPDGGPDPAGLRAVHALALLGGIVGWILGVALRAGPMFIPGWSVPDRLARLLPWTLALGAVVAAGGELGGGPPARQVFLARLGETLGLGTVAVVAIRGGALRPAPRTLPLLSRAAPEARLFRLALGSAVAAAIGSAAAAALAARGVPLSLLADALRHLTTVGFLTGVVLAMIFRLIPVLEGVPLPWPRLRTAAFWALLLAVLGRSGEVLADLAWPGVLAWVPLSGLLAWLAILAAGASLVEAVRRARRRRAQRVA